MSTIPSSHIVSTTIDGPTTTTSIQHSQHQYQSPSNINQHPSQHTSAVGATLMKVEYSTPSSSVNSGTMRGSTANLPFASSATSAGTFVVDVQNPNHDPATQQHFTYMTQSANRQQHPGGGHSMPISNQQQMFPPSVGRSDSITSLEQSIGSWSFLAGQEGNGVVLRNPSHQAGSPSNMFQVTRTFSPQGEGVINASPTNLSSSQHTQQTPLSTGSIPSPTPAQAVRVVVGAVPAGGGATAAGTVVGVPQQRRTNLYVSSLPKHFTESELFHLCSRYGEIVTCMVARDSNGGCKGYGFVNFDNDNSAARAIAELHGLLFQGRMLHVKLADPRANPPPPPRTGVSTSAATINTAINLRQAQQQSAVLIPSPVQSPHAHHHYVTFPTSASDFVATATSPSHHGNSTDVSHASYAVAYTTQQHGGSSGGSNASTPQHATQAHQTFAFTHDGRAMHTTATHANYDHGFHQATTAAHHHPVVHNVQQYHPTTAFEIATDQSYFSRQQASPYALDPNSHYQTTQSPHHGTMHTAQFHHATTAPPPGTHVIVPTSSGAPTAYYHHHHHHQHGAQTTPGQHQHHTLVAPVGVDPMLDGVVQQPTEVRYVRVRTKGPSDYTYSAILQ